MKRDYQFWLYDAASKIHNRNTHMMQHVWIFILKCFLHSEPGVTGWAGVVVIGATGCQLTTSGGAGGGRVGNVTTLGFQCPCTCFKCLIMFRMKCLYIPLNHFMLFISYLSYNFYYLCVCIYFIYSFWLNQILLYYVYFISCTVVLLCVF